MRMTPPQEEDVSKGAMTVPVPVKAVANDASSSTTFSESVNHDKDDMIKSFVIDSHGLSHETPIIKGTVQQPHNDEFDGGVRDVGWHKPSVQLVEPLIGGHENGALFSLIRRFNKDVIGVRAVPIQDSRGLDLNEAWDDEFASQKVTLHLQRAYKAIILPLASFGKHMSRLRSWKETRRTTAFCVTYSLCWILDLLVPLFLGVLIAVVSSRSARRVLFTPVPLSLVNTASGDLQKPEAGSLATHGTLTGAPEKEEGEAVEEEAASFVTNIRHLVQRMVGMHHNEGRDGDPLEGKVPKPVRNAIKSVKAKGSSAGQATQSDDQTKGPMEKLLWNYVSPKKVEPVVKAFPHAIGEVVDNFERLANVISPLPPFARLSFLRIDAILVPLFLASFIVDWYMVYKGTGLAVGFVLFGDPLLKPAFEWLNRSYPHWSLALEPKNNVLRGIPTNNQLTITLLRIGEVNRSALPPVPTSNPEDGDKKYPLDIDDIALDATRVEKIMAIQPVPESHKEGREKDANSKKSKLSKVTRVFKNNTKGVVQTKVAADHVRATLGSESAKGHLGVLTKAEKLIYAGPSHFKGRFEGKEGWACVIEGHNPELAFMTQDPCSEEASHEPVFEIPVEDIKEIRRAAAFSGKAAEAVANFNDRELLGGLEFDDKDGKTWKLTALPERDELFNRLVSIGNQRWMNI